MSRLFILPTLAVSSVTLGLALLLAEVIDAEPAFVVGGVGLGWLGGISAVASIEFLQKRRDQDGEA